MKFKRILCTVLAVLAVSCVFASCSGGESSSEGTSSAEAAQAETTVDVAEIADKLKSDITFEDELIELDSAKIESILGISQDKYTSCKIYISSSGATPEEIDCFEAADEAAAGDIKTALETRVENQKNTFTDYKPEQAPKLEDPVIVTNGKYVYMCISGDNDTAKEIIG